MQKILPISHIKQMKPYMDTKVLDYISEGQSETFEAFENFDIIAFDWYDVHSEREDHSQLLLYMDREDLFIFCQDDAALARAQGIYRELTEETEISNENLLHRFFAKLLKGDMSHLNRLEKDINDDETAILSDLRREYLDHITAWRQELFQLKRYYGQLASIFDDLSTNENHLLGQEAVRRLTILGNRTERYLNSVQNLQESVCHLREAYQAQMSIQQNDLMKVFTVVTVLFLPLSLLVGWYGMNFSGMHELHWRYGYAAVIVLSIGIVLSLLWFFKRRKWL